MEAMNSAGEIAFSMIMRADSKSIFTLISETNRKKRPTSFERAIRNLPSNFAPCISFPPLIPHG